MKAAVGRIRPDAVINELTSLPRHYTPAEMTAAAERDRAYAPAWAALAEIAALSAYYASRPTAECMPEARSLAQRALDIDPELAHAHTTLAHVLTRFDWEFDKAEALYRRAIQITPASASAHHWYAQLLSMLARRWSSSSTIRGLAGGRPSGLMGFRPRAP